MAGWPSAAQRRELGSFPGHAGPEDVERFFVLSPEDLRWVLSHRGDARLDPMEVPAGWRRRLVGTPLAGRGVDLRARG